MEAHRFATELQFFRSRYFESGEPTSHFPGLNLRKNDHPSMVRAVLDGTNQNPEDCVAAVLIVIYRLRNNLFHGAKWGNGLADQLDNFTHANTALMSALMTEETN